MLYTCMYSRVETDSTVMMYEQDQTKATSHDVMPTYQVDYTVILTTDCCFCNLLMSLFVTNWNTSSEGV